MICSLAGAHRWSLFILVLLASMAIVAPARGQTAGIPAAVKTAPEVDTSSRAALEQAISAQIQQLFAPNATAEAQTKARQVLENEAKVNGQPSASPAYLDAYAQILNKQLKALLGNTPNAAPRTKLNAAIAVANIAQLADNVQLADAALLFIKDSNEAVVLWGIKAARWIIPAQLRAFGQANMLLVDAIIPAVQAHSTGIVAGAIVSEAYEALTLNVSDPSLFVKAKPEALSKMVPYVLKLLQARVALYLKGVPPAPRADAVGTRFLADPRVWTLVAANQLQAMQAFVDLIGLAAKQAQAANPGDRSELAITVQRASAAISIIVPKDIADQISGAARLTNQSTAAQIQAAADSVLAAVRKVKGFEGLKDPPTVVGNAPAPPPASAPTTNTVAIPGAHTGVAPGGATTRPGATPGASKTTPAPVTPKAQGAPVATPSKPPVTPAPAAPKR